MKYQTDIKTKFLRDEVNKIIDIQYFFDENKIYYRPGYDDLYISCPFHSERTPSCSVSQSMRVFHCFGCQKKGDLVFLISKCLNKPVSYVIQKYVNEYDIKFPESLKDYKPVLDDAAIQRAINYQKAVNRLNVYSDLLRCMYHLRLKCYERMIKNTVFSDDMVEYYKYCTDIEAMEYNWDELKNNCLHFKKA